MTSEPQNSDSYLIVDPRKTQAKFHEYLNLLGLADKFPGKLTMRDALEIRKDTLGNVESTDNIKILPYLILQKIMTFDIKSRVGLYTGVPQSDLKEIHPLDSIITLLNCCNNFLIQDILTRLSTCQLAIPFLLPNPADGSVRYLLWGMREIIRSWKSADIIDKGLTVSNECRIVDYPAPIVSFYKIGKSQQSKSNIINEVISESKVDYFFNWDCDGGTADKLYVSGMAELCCYLPSGKKDANDFYSNIIIFSNLRGDARNHTKQVDFMHQSSFMSFIVLQEKDFDEAAFKLLKKLAKCPEDKCPVHEICPGDANCPKCPILMFSDIKNAQNIKSEKIVQQIYGMHVIGLKGKNSAQIRKEIRKKLVENLMSGTKACHKKLSECVGIAQSLGIKVDEDDIGCLDGKKRASDVVREATSASDYEARLKFLPLQGPQMWQKWAALDKETYRQLSRENISVDAYSADVERKMKEVRNKQFKHILNPTDAMRVFASNLLVTTGSVRLYFLHWLKMLLDDHSRKLLPKLNNAYHETRADLKKAKAKNTNQQEDSKEVTDLKNKLKLQNDKMVNASFGLEHFFVKWVRYMKQKWIIQRKIL